MSNKINITKYNPNRMMVIMRGLPGSGKDTYIRNRFDNTQQYAVICSADNYFITSSGDYNFIPVDIPKAHEYCKREVLDALEHNTSFVVVNNTNTEYWEYSFYIKLAFAFHYNVEIVDLFDGGCTDRELATRNIHGVPEYTISAMRKRYQRET